MDTDIANTAAEAIEMWWSGLRTFNGHLPAKGTLAGAMIVLKMLEDNYVLDLEKLRTAGGGQIAGVGKVALRKALAECGEDGQFLSEAGRTNRGLPGDITPLLGTLRGLQLDRLSEPERNSILFALRQVLCGKLSEYRKLQHLQFEYDRAKTTWQAIHDILDRAQARKIDGKVAQYLIGAKLAIRFPELTISNDGYSTADAPGGREGDYQINDTVFHVTVAPNPGHYEKCKKNIRDGFRPFMLVPDENLVGTRQNAKAMVPGRLSVEAIETFVSQNIEELSVFSTSGIVSGVRRLLDKYNERVAQVEPGDPSLLIDIPNNLQ